MVLNAPVIDPIAEDAPYTPAEIPVPTPAAVAAPLDGDDVPDPAPLSPCPSWIAAPPGPPPLEMLPPPLLIPTNAGVELANPLLPRHAPSRDVAPCAARVTPAAPVADAIAARPVPPPPPVPLPLPYGPPLMPHVAAPPVPVLTIGPPPFEPAPSRAALPPCLGGSAFRWPTSWTDRPQDVQCTLSLHPASGITLLPLCGRAGTLEG